MKILIRCPTCGKVSEIELSGDITKNTSRGLIAVNIPEKMICKDSFVAYVDKNLNIRDYFTADFQIELPDASLGKVDKFDEQKKDLDERLFDVDLIKINIPAIALAFTLRGIFFGQKTILIIDQLEFLHSHIHNFYENITQNSFDADIKIVSKKDYIENKNNYKDCLVLEGNEIIHDKNKILNPKKIPIERRIIQKFLGEYQEMVSVLMLKNEIQKAFELSKFVLDYLNTRETKKKTDISEINSGLQEKFNVRISPIYLNFVCEIVENYFKIEIPGNLKLAMKVIF
jgi:hypothetical protein